MQYGIKSMVGNFPAAVMTMETAGFMCPPDTPRVNNMTSAKEAPMAKGFPVANMTYTKNVAPKNSNKYF